MPVKAHLVDRCSFQPSGEKDPSRHGWCLLGPPHKTILSGMKLMNSSIQFNRKILKPYVEKVCEQTVKLYALHKISINLSLANIRLYTIYQHSIEM
ncbi:hypothetical protein GDO81_015085 [Engystomops pustulosus]|uniref:Uncharacterized protein n=1 Tax=Engystomops pustulosus TaxID=76066 RepID=A0AAV7AGP2_ENGPU|nr:hypothetical protein GDO81_015085 [Engystomops pustulosus]